MIQRIKVIVYTVLALSCNTPTSPVTTSDWDISILPASVRLDPVTREVIDNRLKILAGNQQGRVLWARGPPAPPTSANGLDLVRRSPAAARVRLRAGGKRPESVGRAGAARQRLGARAVLAERLRSDAPPRA